MRLWLGAGMDPFSAPNVCRFGVSHCQRLAHRGKRDAEFQYEEDEPQNDAWQAVFDNGDEVQRVLCVRAWEQ